MYSNGEEYLLCAYSVDCNGMGHLRATCVCIYLLPSTLSALEAAKVHIHRTSGPEFIPIFISSWLPSKTRWTFGALYCQLPDITKVFS